MTALYIVLGVILAVIALILILLSLNIAITVHYEEDVTVNLKWLFIKKTLVPGEKKKKKAKKEKKAAEEESEIIPEPKKKKKKDNIFLNFYNNKGVEGVIQLLKDAVSAIGGLFKRVYKSLCLDEIFVSLTVGAGDSAETAIKYGKACSAVFPAMGFIVDNMRVNKYSVEVIPDFINSNNEAKLHAKILIRPIKVINALIILVFELLFKVVIKLLMHGASEEEKVEKHLKHN